MSTTETAQPVGIGGGNPMATQADSPLRRTIRRFLLHRLAVVGVVIGIVFVLGALVGSEDVALRQSLTDASMPPSDGHWFGTDRNGRDVLSRTLVGGRVSLLVGVVAVSLATVIGTVLGSIAGYYRVADVVIMRIVDVVMSFPTIILLLIAVAIFGPGIVNLMIMIGLITWTLPCRIVRGQFLQLRESDFVIAARCIGLTDRAIVLRHIIPNSLAPLLVFMSLGVASAVLTEAGLSYLGLGVQPPTPSWGNMLNAARSLTTLERFPWQWIPPAIMTVTFVLAVNFIGDGLRDALDPRSVHER